MVEAHAHWRLRAQANNDDERWAAVDGLRLGGRNCGNGGADSHSACGEGQNTVPDTAQGGRADDVVAALAAAHSPRGGRARLLEGKLRRHHARCAVYVRAIPKLREVQANRGVGWRRGILRDHNK